MDRSGQVRNSTTQGAPWLTLIVVMFCSFVVGAQAQQSMERNLHSDREALERFMVAVDPAGVLLPWESGTNPCTWIGVDCDQSRVTSLRIPGLRLAGALPANTLSDLDHLRALTLHHNQFSGAFPLELARCALLERLFLAYNHFSGPLPDFTGLWPGMTHLSLGFNNFSGEIPTSMNALKGLRLLEFQRNTFSGEIPLLCFDYLLTFSVADNRLVGPVPTSLQRFSASEFAGNVGLCGPPTAIPCSGSSIASAMASVPAPETSMDSGAVTPSLKTHSKLMSAGVAAVIAVGVVAVAVLLIYILCRSHGVDSHDKSRAGLPAREYSHMGVEFHHAGDTHHHHAVKIDHGSLVFFDKKQQRAPFAIEELLRASATTLGNGRVGTSYRADLGAFVVVVKRLKDVVVERNDFESHVETFGRLKHSNLVAPRAFFFSKDEKVIVTDYMPQGNLHSLLHSDRDDEARVHVDWATRTNIALGTARALAYLHKGSVKLIHGNIKSTNVLLSRDLEPLLCDYALAPLLSHGEVSTQGYRALEVTDTRKSTMESDVYSFGVLLLEVLTGQAPVQEGNKWLDLPEWVMGVVREKWMSEVLDVELLRDSDAEGEMAQTLQLALACVGSFPDRRPKMDEVVLLLEDITGDDSSFRPSDQATQPRIPSKPRACAPILDRPSSGVFVVAD